MDKKQRLVYIKGMLLQAEITLESMKTANKERELSGEALAYSEDDFIILIDKFHICHNSLITEIRGF